MTTNELSRLMKRAWIIKRETAESFSECLKRAWKLFFLAKRMRAEEAVRFTFRKVDGSIREAIGTLKEVASLIKGTGTDTPSTFKYYDVEKGAFRSFRITSLIAVC